MTTATTSSMERLYFATHTYAELDAGITDVCCWHVIPDDGRTARFQSLAKRAALILRTRAHAERTYDDKLGYRAFVAALHLQEIADAEGFDRRETRLAALAINNPPPKVRKPRAKPAPKHDMVGQEEFFTHMVATHMDGISRSWQPLTKERDTYQWTVDHEHENEPHKAGTWYQWFTQQVAAEVVRQIDAMISERERINHALISHAAVILAAMKTSSKKGTPTMTKLATIFAAGCLSIFLAIALTISTADAAEYDGPRLKLRGDDTAIQLRDGRHLQLEYIGFHALNHDTPGYTIWEDGSVGIVDENGCSVLAPNGTRHALRDC